MRADRLISILLLLQNHGKMTARALAQILETSERTIYRDIDALSTSGVPVYSEKGPGGGICLLESYRTTLTGLNADETRALFMLSTPAPLTQLGVSQDLTTALLKLTAALPASRQQEEERTRQRFLLDSTWWSDNNSPTPYLQPVQQALWQDLRLLITYKTMFGAMIEIVIEPLGLVAKASVWYLVYAFEGSLRVIRASSLINVELLPEHFTRPNGFDLQSFWDGWCKEHKTRRQFIAVVRIKPELAAELPRVFGEDIRQQISSALPDSDGWLNLTLSFEHFFAARERILGYGRAIEVVSPLALRESVADFARQITDLYSSPSV